MNFFEHQDRARRQTRILIGLFALAVLATLVAINLVMLAVFGYFESPEQGWFSPGFWRYNSDVVIATSLVAGAIIGLGSLYRVMSLRGGGSAVARELGAVPVDPATTDPLRRRLHNVVEEMAIASGIPVPEVFVLEHEEGINAFAAGFSTGDAAVAVTRGTLETLNREELQGVVAHEFSHIFNGDMRLNMRLTGVLFGILLISIVGRRMLFAAHFSGGRGRNNAGGVLAVGLVVMVVGYIGLLFGRLIKAWVSRQREFLADASAVQFTRNPASIAGALKKIGARAAGSRLHSDSEEVGHMLFARGSRRDLFATHPPLLERIRAIEPGFQPDEFERIARDMDRHREARAAEAEQARARTDARETERGPGGLPLDAGRLAEGIGQADAGQLAIAAALLAAVPGVLERAVHSDEWVQELVCLLLLDPDPAIRDRQLLEIARQLGDESEAQVRYLFGAVPELDPTLRLPLLEMSFPALRRRPEDELRTLMQLVETLIHADGEVDVFEYALGRLLTGELGDALEPGRGSATGRARLADHEAAVIDLVTVIARHGQPGDDTAATAAFRAGLEGLVQTVPETMPAPAPDWTRRIDDALEALDELRPAERQKLVAGLTRCVTHSGTVTTAETELLRAVCGALHVPLGVIGGFS